MRVSSVNQNSHRPIFKANLNVTPELKDYLASIKKHSGHTSSQIKGSFKNLDNNINDDSITLSLCKKEYNYRSDSYHLVIAATDGQFSNEVVKYNVRKNEALSKLIEGFSETAKNVKLSRGGMCQTIDALV